MKKTYLVGIAAGLALAVGLGSGCGHSVEKIESETNDAEVQIIGGAEGTTTIILDREEDGGAVKSGRDEAADGDGQASGAVQADGAGQASGAVQADGAGQAGGAGQTDGAGQTGAQVPKAAELLKQLAGSSWRLAGDKTEEHLQQYNSLQAMWGTGIHYGSGMEFGKDGSFSFHIAINYGGSGTVSERDGELVAEITPYGLEYGENTAGTPEQLVITPVEEDGTLYLTTPRDGEKMYWEPVESSCSFADFSNVRFRFSSGAGGWATLLDIAADGSFSGTYEDSDMGDRGDGYPNGTQYRCDFSGQFTEMEKVDAYTYSMQIAELTYEKEPGTEEIRDGILYRYHGAYGLEGAENILIYLPDTPIAELPEEFLSWADYPDLTTQIPLYGLYNEAQGYGFSSYQKAPVNDSLLASRLIDGQYFDVYLTGWDNVTFAAFRPDLAENPDGDAVFMLLKDGEAVYQFPGYDQDNTVTGEPFRDVLAVAFEDVDGDGNNDILIINEYGTGGGNGTPSVRIYSQKTGEKEFVLDKFEPSLDAYLNENHYNDTIANVKKGIKSYKES